MMRKIKQLPKIIKLTIFLILSFLYVLVFNKTLVLAYTGSDVVNVHFSNDWANHTTISGLNQDVVNTHIQNMQSQIYDDMSAYNYSYYYVFWAQDNGTDKIMYEVDYFNSLTHIQNRTLNNLYIQYPYKIFRWDYESGVSSRARNFTMSISNGTMDTLFNINDVRTRNFDCPHILKMADENNLFLPNQFFIDTNVPIEIIKTMNIKLSSSSEYPIIKLNGATTLTRGSTYSLSSYLYDVLDAEKPVLDFTGITTPYEMWQGDTFDVPTPTATDNIDGDISSDIQVSSTLNPNVAGDYDITYKVCDKSNNCTTAIIPIKVKNPWAEINMTGKSAILFWYKDFTQVLSPNAYCDSIEMTGSCFVQSFDYLGRWKYSKVNLSNLDTLLYENGGIYAPLDPASTNFKTYEHINIGHLTSGFEVGSEYGVLMYNESGANIVKIIYNQKYFDYRIYNSLNDTDEKEIPFIDVGGNNQNTTDVAPPYTDLEDPATEINPTTAGIFSSFTTNTFGLTAIISAPLNLINQLTNKSCVPVNLPLPYLDNKYLILPCMTTIYETYLGSFFSLYQLITFGVVAYWVIVRLLNMIKDFKNPDHDEIEVLDL